MRLAPGRGVGRELERGEKIVDAILRPRLSQEVGLALGAQAGEARLREVVTAAGFTRFRRATETPFNLILEARR